MNSITYRPACYDERNELLEWLAQNKLALDKYDSDELVHLAVTCGFPLAVVCEIIATWVTDRMTHTSYRIREDWYVDRELKHASSGQFSLKPQWELLAKRLLDGKDFEDVA